MLTRLRNTLGRMWAARQADDDGGGVWHSSLDFDAGDVLTLAGEVVGPDAGMRLSAYFGCCKVVSEDVAKLPLFTYRRLSPRGKELAPGHPVYNLLHLSPSEESTSMTIRENIQQHALSRGNGYAEIVRDGRGLPVEWHYVSADRVKPKRDDNDRVYYEVRNTNGTSVRIRPSDMVHVRGPGGTLTGWSVAKLAAECLGGGLAMQKFASAYFGNGTTIEHVVELEKPLSPKGRQALRESFEKQHRGAANSHRPVILWPGVKYQKIGTPADEAQFIESRQFTVEDICRWFRVPPHKIQHLLRATYSNIEHQGIEYVTDTLLPWLVRWEQELNRKFFRDDPEHFCEHQLLGLLRGDAASRAAFYKTLFELGVLSSDDIAELENRNPIPGGERRFISTNLQPLDGAAASRNQPTQPMEPNRLPADDGARNQNKAAYIVYSDAMRQIMGIEANFVAKAVEANKIPDWGNFFRSQGQRIAEKFITLVRAFNDGEVEPAVRKWAAEFVAASMDAYNGVPRNTWHAKLNEREDELPRQAATRWINGGLAHENIDSCAN